MATLAVSLWFASPALAQPDYDEWVLFVTFNEFGVEESGIFPPLFPNFGVIEAADYFTNECADIAGLIDWDGSSTIFRAVLSTSDNDAIIRFFDPNTNDLPVVNVFGEQIVPSYLDLFDSPSFTAPIREEFGGLPEGGSEAVWTGSLCNGNKSGSTCRSWTSQSGFGTIGRPGAMDGTWLSDVNHSCAASARIYGMARLSDLGISTLTGDFDDDGDVDGSDFLKWQRGEPPNPFSQRDLKVWQMNYGQTSSALSAATTVPEPSTALLAILGLVLATRRRRGCHWLCQCLPQANTLQVAP